MDKETLSHYGWIVILVLILAVLLALASPFGNFVAGAIKATTAGFFSVNESALGVAGITIPGQGYEGDPAPCNIEGHYIGDGRGEHMIPVTDCASNHTYTCECDGWVVPENGTYYIGVTSTATGDYTGATATYTAGQKLPCGYVTQTGDVYKDEDYEYRYNQYYNYSKWYDNDSQNGWAVRVLDNTKNTYGAILGNINNKSITSIAYTFLGCKSLVSAPVIPDTIINMCSAFDGCTNLKTYVGSTDPDGDFSNYTIPNTVKDMRNTFYSCSSLKIAPTIPNSVTNMNSTFKSCSALVNAPSIPSSVTSMISTFAYCSSLVDAPNMSNATNVEDMTTAFQSCSKLIAAPDLSNCTQLATLRSAFCYCNKLTTAPTLPDNDIDMSYTFNNCKSLKTYPGSTDIDGDFSNYKLPSNLTNMSGTFTYCESMTVAPVIPDKVTTIYHCFSYTSIETAPVIPKSVTSVGYTFAMCESLVSAPVIPETVNNMNYTFYGCSSLTGTITINTTSTSYSNCFYCVDMSDITLTGKASIRLLNNIGRTGDNWTPIS